MMRKNMEKIISFASLYLILGISAEDVIYQLEDADYYRMPEKNKLDHFEMCVGAPGGVYCSAHADLLSEEPSELLDMIRAYSAHGEKHFNYSNIMYGLCLTGSSCRQFYNGDNSHQALWKASEACLNHSLSRDYQLKARVFDMHCYHHGMSFTPDALDWFVAGLLGAFALLNVIGTFYDVFIRDQSRPGNRFMMAFSILSNWNYMVAPASADPRQVQLRPIHGIRVITSILVILGHVPVGSVLAIFNPTWFEWAYRITLYHVLFQGHLITLTFFVISGFLLTYNARVQAEQRRLDWRVLPKAVLFRWSRLAPVSTMILLLTATWMRHTGFGPFWWPVIGREWQDCRQYWLYNALFINNLVDHSTCNLQMWSLASDMQLHVVGLIIVLLVPARMRRWALGALYALGVLWPAYHVYTKDLDGTILATPSTISSFFLTSDAFNYVYKRTYSNLPCFVMGMIFGELVYDLQKKDLIKCENKKYFWVLITVALGLPATILASYFLFFQDAPRASLLTRMLFAPVIKPLFGSCVMLIILGAIYRIDKVISELLGWSGWLPLARVSYCMYAVHVSIVRYLAGTKHVLAHSSLFHLFQEYTGTVVLTVLFALVLHLLVEAPSAGLIRLCTGSLSAKPVKSETNGHQGNGHQTNGYQANGHQANGRQANGHQANGRQANGHRANGRHTNGLKKD